MPLFFGNLRERNSQFLFLALMEIPESHRLNGKQKHLPITINQRSVRLAPLDYLNIFERLAAGEVDLCGACMVHRYLCGHNALCSQPANKVEEEQRRRDLIANVVGHRIKT